jgi:amidase
MARRTEDISALMLVLAGADGEDPTAVDLGFTPLGPRALRKLRVAFFADGASPEVAQVVRSAARAISADVAVVEEDRPDCLDATYDLEMKLIGADGGDGLRAYLHSLGSTKVHPLLTAWLDKLEAYRTDLVGFQAYWHEWDDYRARMTAFFRRYDVLLCPAYPQPALPHGTSVIDANFRGFRATMAFNLSGQPAATVRCGESEDGLPIAVQVAAPAWREDWALAVSARLEEALGGWQAPAL